MLISYQTEIIMPHENRLSDENLDFLYEMILTLESKEECHAFFYDLCTAPELKSIAQRAVVAKMLDERHNYREIAEKTGASTATISRVNRSLRYGEDGYRTVLDKMNK